MARASRASKTSGDGPMLGALLRNVRGQIIERVLLALATAGYEDIRDAHMVVFQHPPPRGTSPLALAQRAKMSKQAMNQLLGTLEVAGYLERRDADDRPGRREIWLTPSGEAATALMRREIRAAERAFARKVGARRFAAMVACLRDLARRDK